MGGIAIGGVAIGGMSIGGVAFGGLGVGLLSISGASIGLFAVGGVSCGWAAIGGMAVGWLALGGAAIAWRAANGGLAIAHDFAIGGTVHAAHANDVAARDYFEQSRFFLTIEPVMMTIAAFVKDHPVAYNIGLFTCIFLSSIASWFMTYRRRKTDVLGTDKESK